jgi:hypothetical protein
MGIGILAYSMYQRSKFIQLVPSYGDSRKPGITFAAALNKSQILWH